MEKPKRVLMLIENLSFPMDRRMYQQALALQNNGYQVAVICPKGQNADRSPFEVVDDISVYRYDMHFEAKSGLGYLIEYSWAMLRTFLLMWRCLFKNGFDIVHVANPPDLFFAIAAPFKLMGKTFVYDQHDLCPEVYEAKFNQRDLVHTVLLWLEKLSYRMADLVISPNLSYREIALTRGNVPSEKIEVVRSAPDLHRFHHVEPQPQLKRGALYLVAYLGVMGRQDGVDRALHAASHLIKTLGRSDVRFVFIGNGECWNELQRLAVELELTQRVEFTGRIPDSEVLAYLSTADICVAPDPPSRLNDLSTMNKILEYMACRKPIVSFDLTEARRSAADAALFVKEDDPACFAGAILQLLNDGELRARMGEAGFERIARQLSWEHSKANLIEAYRRISRQASTIEVSPRRVGPRTLKPENPTIAETQTNQR
jgi:glycosyltransferase involved in cell wall biosynthesis